MSSILYTMDISHGWLLIQVTTAMTTCMRKMEVDIHLLEPLNKEAKARWPTAALQCHQNQYILLQFKMQCMIETNDSLHLSHCFGVETVCANRSAADNGTETFCLGQGTFCLNCTYTKNNNTGRPLNTLKYNNNNTSSGTQTVPLK